jgi:hypothetical protein
MCALNIMAQTIPIWVSGNREYYNIDVSDTSRQTIGDLKDQINASHGIFGGQLRTDCSLIIGPINDDNTYRNNRNGIFLKNIKPAIHDLTHISYNCFAHGGRKSKRSRQSRKSRHSKRSRQSKRSKQSRRA